MADRKDDKNRTKDKEMSKDKADPRDSSELIDAHLDDITGGSVHYNWTAEN